ncbi:MAG: hypothetical protein AMJ41_01335 [candidate division Zixibacteria bacterium DG_27]|nr:MAG: hypothetical protein AMJ41_01335 [candidate division Zixibacteria bacterium DG_27]
MGLRQKVRENLQSSFLVALIGIALLIAQTGFAAVSLQEVYENAGPGEGYDKLMILDPQETYIGDLWISGYLTVCIRGNGALVTAEGGSCYSIAAFGAIVDVDHLVIEADRVGILFGFASSGKVRNNTIVGADDYGIRTYDINLTNGVEIFNNIIVNNTYGIYCDDGYLPEYIAYNDLWNNLEGNYMKYCEG